MKTLLLVSMSGQGEAPLRAALEAQGFTLKLATTQVAYSPAPMDEVERRHMLALRQRLGTKQAVVMAACRRAHLEMVGSASLLIDDVQAILLSVDVMAGHRYLAQAKVPTFLLPHAILPQPVAERRWDGSHVFTSHVFSPGPYSTARYARQTGLTVHETGRPCWDPYATLDTKAARTEAMAMFHLDPTRPIVCFGGTWLERSTAHATRHLPALFQVFKDVCAAVRQSDAQLVVKLHPGEVARCRGNVAGLTAGYTAVARTMGLEHCVVTPGNREQVLSAADLVVAMNSNLAFEALLCGTPVVNVPLVPEDAACLFDPKDWSGAVWALAGPEEVGEVLGNILEGRLFLGMMAKTGTTVRRYHPTDGKSAERVAAVIAQICQ